jgi:hypothetical protein
MLRCATALIALLATCGAFMHNAHNGCVKLVPAAVPAVRASKVQAAAGKASVEELRRVAQLLGLSLQRTRLLLLPAAARHL